MPKQSDTILSDGRILGEKFDAADGIISAGELDYRDFSSPLVRKVVFLQNEFSQEARLEKYDGDKVQEFHTEARHFLTELKDGTLTESDSREFSKRLKAIFPKIKGAKPAVKQR